MGDTAKLKIINNDGENEAPWYSKGLRFKCTECGKCCTGKPGYVWVSEEEIQNIANFLNISYKKAMRTYVRKKNNRYSLIELPSSNNDCIFLKGKICQIYTARPKQCRTFPWWVQNLRTAESWQEAAKECEGISPDAPLVPIEEIERNLFS
jgi:uncharacterized protein